MGFTCGIVGLPNVGKSTLFNALTATIAAQAANYPFCTIEPNVGRIAVPDARLDEALAAVIICAKGADPNAEDLIAHCRETLAAYKVPRHYRFVTPEDLPLTSTGKLEKRRLPELFDKEEKTSR